MQRRPEPSAWVATPRSGAWATARCGITGDGIWGPAEGSRRRDRRPAPSRRARRQLHRHRRLLRPGRQRGADRRGASPLPGRPRHRDQGRPDAARARASGSRDCRPEHLREACEGSLRRLRVERIDLYQLHTVDPRCRWRSPSARCAELRDEGKVAPRRRCPTSTCDQLAARARSSPIVSVQNRYTIGDRESEPVLEVCDRDGIAFIPWFPLAPAAWTPTARSAGRRRARSDPVQVALAWLLRAPR